MAITASEARRGLFPLIEKVDDDRSAIEITSKRGNAVLMSAADHAAWQETVVHPDLRVRLPAGAAVAGRAQVGR